MAKVSGRIEIGMEGITAGRALEEVPVANPQMAAPGANTGGVGWVREDHRYSQGIGFVLDKPLKLGKSPGVELPSPLLSFPLGILPEVGQVFHDDDRVRKACGPLHQPLADDVVCILLKPSLSPGEPLKSSSCRASALLLQTPSHPLIVLFFILKHPAAEKSVFIASGGHR